MAFDKDKPASTTSLRSSNPEILANWDALETALDREHEFSTGGTVADQAHHKKGSARAYFQDAQPTTRVDGTAFTSEDLGSLWFDTNSSPDNIFYVLTVTTPTWTLVSTEIIATLLASNREFAGTLDVVGNFDPTTYETTNGGFLDEDDMVSDAADKVGSQQSIKAYADLDSTGSVMHDAEGGFNNCDVDGTKTKVYTKYFTGTLDADASTSVAHGITGIDNILHVSASVFTSTSIYVVGGFRDNVVDAFTYELTYDGTNVFITAVGANLQGRNYRIKVDYKL